MTSKNSSQDLDVILNLVRVIDNLIYFDVYTWSPQVEPFADLVWKWQQELL